MSRLSRYAACLIVLLGGLSVPASYAFVGDQMVHDRSPVISHVQTVMPYVAITVDDFYTGDYRRLTAIHILEVANAAHAALTLCPAGSGLQAYSRLEPAQATEIQQLVAAGTYELCDHTYSHPVLTKLPAAAQEKEILNGQVAIKRFFGRAPSSLFRPPYGSWNAQTQEAAYHAGYGRIITWSIDSGDSEGPEKPVQMLLADVACAGPGDIILTHANRRSTAAAMPKIIAMLRAKGLEPVTLSTLLANGTPAYSYNPADMRRLYTCGHHPTPAPAGPPSLPGTPSALPVPVSPSSVPGVPPVAPAPAASDIVPPEPAPPPTPRAHRRNDPEADG
ncbi:MAG: polysaccharide deacetylase family protein [Herpetosiphonaceae bacterium]|nr:polysaccharide deacetylase family protein [Herpetosiphonaceae bacterium]